MSRPLHVIAYDSHDLVVLAGAYAHPLVENHPFVDGNKRVSLVVARVFLGMNGLRFNPPAAETVIMVEGLASGCIPEADAIRWVEKHSR